MTGFSFDPKGAVAHLRKAGYLEEWRYHTTRSGVPQGGVVSPSLSNLSLDRLDRCVEMALLPASNYGKRRSPYPPYIVNNFSSTPFVQPKPS